MVHAPKTSESLEYKHHLMNIQKQWLKGEQIPIFELKIIDPDTIELYYIIDNPEFKLRLYVILESLLSEFPDFIFPSTMKYVVALDDDGTRSTTLKIKLTNLPASEQDQHLADIIWQFIQSEINNAHLEYLSNSPIFKL